MKILLDVKDSKAGSLLDILNNLPYVKTRQLTESKAHLLSDIAQAISEVVRIRTGRKSARDAEKFLPEL